jgi:hypothetical protein
MDILWGDADPWELVAWGEERVRRQRPEVWASWSGPLPSRRGAPDVCEPVDQDFVMRNA